jgi:amidase
VKLPDDASIVELQRALHSGELTSRELVERSLERISSDNPSVGALVHVDEGYARARADEIDREGFSDPSETLRGLPTADKDLVRRAGMPTRYGSRTRELREIDTESDPMATWLDDVGAISVGKSATSEFGMAGYTETRLEGVVRNPMNPERQVGGSSGGAAAAVAAGFFPFAPGSDGGGSIRIPALACGVVGWKPSRGLIPAGSGLESPAGLAVPGLLTRTVADLETIAPQLLRGSWEWAVAAPAKTENVIRRVGVTRRSPWPQEWGIGPDEKASAALDYGIHALEGAGVEVVELEWQPDESYHEHFLTVWAVTAAAIDVDDEALLEPLTRYLRAHAQSVSSVEFSRALAKLKDFERDTIRAFSVVDAVMTPGLAFAPPPIGFFSEDPQTNFRQQVEFTPWTSFVNVAGLPAVVLPTALESEGIPRGVQLIGRPGADLAIISLATRLERLFGAGVS